MRSSRVGLAVAVSPAKRRRKWPNLVESDSAKQSLSSSFAGPRILEASYFNSIPTLVRCLQTQLHVTDTVGKGPLHLACGKGHVEACRILLDFGADPNSREKRKGRTSLHFAVLGNHVDVLELLHQKGGDVTLVDDCGNNCLHLAGKHAHVEVMQWLLLHGVDPHALNNKGKSPKDLVMAVPSTKVERFAALELLLTHQ